MTVSVERYQNACPDDPRSSWKRAPSFACQQMRYLGMKVRKQVEHSLKRGRSQDSLIKSSFESCCSCIGIRLMFMQSYDGAVGCGIPQSLDAMSPRGFDRLTMTVLQDLLISEIIEDPPVTL